MGRVLSGDPCVAAGMSSSDVERARTSDGQGSSAILARAGGCVRQRQRPTSGTLAPVAASTKRLSNDAMANPRRAATSR